MPSPDRAVTGPACTGSLAPQRISVTGNVIGPDCHGVFTSGPVTVTGGPHLYFQVNQKLGTAPAF